MSGEDEASSEERSTRRPFTDEQGRRRVHSFVLRRGRLTDAQARAMRELWPRYGLDYRGERCDLDATFGRSKDKVLEIGFGNGQALRHACEHEPQRDFLGIEVHRPGVGRLMNALAAAGLDNARLYCHDAVEVLTYEIVDGALAEIRIWFPDPWHKQRHHKRRLIQPAFAALLAAKLRAGGLLHLATDWHDYARQMWEVLDAEPRLRNRAGLGARGPRPPWRPQTHFETRALQLQHGVWELLYQRTEDRGQRTER